MSLVDWIAKMLIKVVVASTHYSFREAGSCRVAIEGLRASHARYLKKAHEADMAAERLQQALDREIEKEQAKKAARKAAKQEGGP